MSYLQIFCLVLLANIVLLVEANTYTNPIVPSSPDPWMTYYKGYYYFTATTGDNTVRIRKSKTLDGLKSAPQQIVFNDGLHNTWAPEFHQWNGRWYLYYTAGRTADIMTQRLHVAESAGDDPMGPYHFKADLVGSGDNTLEVDANLMTIKNKLYLLGAFNNNGQQHIFIKPMINPWTASAEKSFLAAPTMNWEKAGFPVNEAPEGLHHNNRTYVVYSASSCSTVDYSLGLLEFVGTDPLNAGHWHKFPQPIFRRSDRTHVYGPGHNGFFTSPNGQESWIVYHGNDKNTGNMCTKDGRTARAQKFTWNADGTPNFGEPQPAHVALTAPAGE
ncbi:extracellular exo-alpha-(1-_5)-L-arabinofuranosidase-like [Oppia nitens]|uniref:extracellular exo-alpha-(1->5)-L-arabinofuranosidase-like n=1 Tax=Oppia nitens TaxID=1686743 RepID=UPI0023DA78FB|nr:extracellular exo-alpha-(1->5)-L-arabinofuranosidase-like [Oppia nitens]